MDRQDYGNNIINKLLVCLYTVGSCLPVAAQPSNTNIAGPSASATGNVTNQAVQVLQGPFNTQSFGSGTVCQSATLSVNTFAMGNLNGNADPFTYQTHTGNGGITVSLNVPLDGSVVELCKERARVEIARMQAEADKSRLDFELVRLLRCGEAARQGIRFHPDSPYAGICADVLVLNTNT